MAQKYTPLPGVTFMLKVVWGTRSWWCELVKVPVKWQRWKDPKIDSHRKRYRWTNASLLEIAFPFPMYVWIPQDFLENAVSVSVSLGDGPSLCILTRCWCWQCCWTWVQQDPKAVIFTQKSPNRLKLSQQFWIANVPQVWLWIMLNVMNPNLVLGYR